MNDIRNSNYNSYADNLTVEKMNEIDDYKKTLKRTLKEWEYEFASLKGRKPNKDDISKDMHMSKQYQLYAKIKNLDCDTFNEMKKSIPQIDTSMDSKDSFLINEMRKSEISNEKTTLEQKLTYKRKNTIATGVLFSNEKFKGSVILNHDSSDKTENSVENLATFRGNGLQRPSNLQSDGYNEFMKKRLEIENMESAKKVQNLAKKSIAVKLQPEAQPENQPEAKSVSNISNLTEKNEQSLVSKSKSNLLKEELPQKVNSGWVSGQLESEINTSPSLEIEPSPIPISKKVSKKSTISSPQKELPNQIVNLPDSVYENKIENKEIKSKLSVEQDSDIQQPKTEISNDTKNIISSPLKNISKEDLINIEEPIKTNEADSDLIENTIIEPKNEKSIALSTLKSLQPTSVFERLPKDGILRCRIFRRSSILDKAYPTFYLHNDIDNEFILSARKRKKSALVNYVISGSMEDTSKDSIHFLALIKANFGRTNFIITDARAYKKSNPDIKLRELACVCYTKNVLPRVLSVAIPDSKLAENDGSYNETDVITDMKNKSEKWLHLRNKAPRWNDSTQSHCLNFGGRVTQPSVKNFQLIEEGGDGTIYMQFGRCGPDEFSLDARWPMTTLEAFTIALSTFEAYDGT